MKKVVAIIGSPRKGETLKAVKTFEEKLKKISEVEFNYVFLKDYRLESCRGCFLCLEKGEELCPSKDDRDKLVNFMMEADGVIFASPVYSLQVTALMKNFLDRLAYTFHRPCFFNKAYTTIVTQAVFGKKETLKYLEEVGGWIGFNVSKGVALNILPGEKTQKEQRKIDREIEKSVIRFNNSLENPIAKLSYKRAAFFHLVRTLHKHSLKNDRDYNYFKDKGWFESEYYCKAKISLPKKILGAFVDFFATLIAKKGKK